MSSVAGEEGEGPSRRGCAAEIIEAGGLAIDGDRGVRGCDRSRGEALRLLLSPGERLMEASFLCSASISVSPIIHMKAPFVRSWSLPTPRGALSEIAGYPYV